MSARRLRRLVVLALAVGVGYWIYKDRPTASGLIDSITGPLMGSRAAVKSSERNRVVGEATTTISDQADTVVGTLREGMTTSEVRDLIGEPNTIEQEKVDGVLRTRWTYTKLRRALVVRDGRVISIVIL